MLVKLRDIQEKTVFHLGNKYKKGWVYRGNSVRCEPFLGGQFQTNPDLGEWIDLNSDVEVTKS
jgi:hypothetical protein